MLAKALLQSSIGKPHYIISLRLRMAARMTLKTLCRYAGPCHKEYTSGQTIERNTMRVSLTVKDDGEITAQVKEGPVESLGRWL